MEALAPWERTARTLTHVVAGRHASSGLEGLQSSATRAWGHSTGLQWTTYLSQMRAVELRQQPPAGIFVRHAVAAAAAGTASSLDLVSSCACASGRSSATPPAGAHAALVRSRAASWPAASRLECRGLQVEALADQSAPRRRERYLHSCGQKPPRRRLAENRASFSRPHLGGHLPIPASGATDRAPERLQARSSPRRRRY